MEINFVCDCINWYKLLHKYFNGRRLTPEEWTSWDQHIIRNTTKHHQVQFLKNEKKRLVLEQLDRTQWFMNQLRGKIRKDECFRPAPVPSLNKGEYKLLKENTLSWSALVTRYYCLACFDKHLALLEVWTKAEPKKRDYITAMLTRVSDTPGTTLFRVPKPAEYHKLVRRK